MSTNENDFNPISKLRKYKFENSSNVIRSRSMSILLDKIRNINNDYTFLYKGSQKKPYMIKVFENGNLIKTHCSCPYDYGELCKHEVAAIDYVIAEKSNNTGKNKPTRQKQNEIILHDHLISDEFISSLLEKTNHHYLIDDYYIKFDTVIQNKIETSCDWPIGTQTFEYFPEKTILKSKCSCKEFKRKKLCVHIPSALNYIKNNYEEDVFNPNYLERNIDQFLQLYGMSREDNYQKYFDFSLGINGFEVYEKIKNIVPSIEIVKENIIPKIDSKVKDSLQLLVKQNKAETTYGIGFCFDYIKSEGYYIFNFLPFKAKYRKRSIDFISSFNKIDQQNFIEMLRGNDWKDKDIVLKILEFQDMNVKLFAKEFSIETYRNAFILFKNLINQSKQYSFFEKNNKNSLTKKNLKPIQFKDETPTLFFTFIENEYFYTLKPKLKIDNKTYQINSSLINIFPFFCKKDQDIYLFDNPNVFIYISKFQQRSELNFQKKEYARLYKEIIQPIAEHFEIENKVYKNSKKQIAEVLLQKQVYLSDYESEYVLFKLGIQYDKQLILLNSREQLFNEKTQSLIKRNEAFENNFLEEFKALHSDFQNQEGVFFLTPHQLIEDEWLLKASEKMTQKGITVFGAKDLKSFKFNLHKPTISMGVKSDIDWFDLKIEIRYGKEKVSLKDIRKALLNKSKYIQLSDGSLGVLPKEWLNKFSKYFKAGEVKNNMIKISNYQFNIIDELHDDLEKTPDFLVELMQKKKCLQNLNTKIEVQPPKNLKATLRPYQIQGLNWMAFLDENNLGGCLADDMGLGKTLQTIAFLSHLKSHNKATFPHLVIAPTSLIFNWEKEIGKFCPSLTLLIYTGIKRKSLVKSFAKYDIILSTYGSLLNDINFLKDIEFSYVILDESQAIKNPNSKRYKAVRLLNAENRITLTGTPIENNTFDLYSQMNFLNPGLLGSMGHFKTEFSDAIDKIKNEQASTLLSQMIHPFLLRRTKEQVATELPEKTESVLYCEMGVEQRKVYDSFKDKFREYLLGKIDENGVKKSQMYVLEGLTKLRQICNSPELLNNEEDYGRASIKLDILIENIQNKTSNHKVLVFSQFTTMLQLVKDRLENENIHYEYLDGKTRNREEKVTNFQENDSVRVFLISLKAGGLGLNLIAADYVFLIDPWWNPAVENQAIDRCYRIGQTKHVMAYKMICKGTVEEKIIGLQQNKKQISNSIIQVDKIEKSFNTKQIKELFS